MSPSAERTRKYARLSAPLALACAGFAGLVCVSLAARGASAARSGGTVIAYTRPSGEGHSEIWVRDPDLGSAKRLTAPRSEVSFGDPTWSPDGTSIAYSRQAARSELWTMTERGTGKRRLERAPKEALDYNAAWSPQGGLIAFIRTPKRCVGRKICRSELWVMRADGGSKHRVVSKASQDAMPAWSPDGSMIALGLARPGEPRDSEIRDLGVVDVATGAVRRLYGPVPEYVSPDWSPDGAEIAYDGWQWPFDSPEPSRYAGIHTVAPDGTAVRRLTERSDYFARWSPDGSRLAFVRLEGAAAGLTSALWIIDRDGSHARRAWQVQGLMVPSAWSPDGKRLLVTEPDPEDSIYVVNADGSGRMLLAPGYEPAWQPRVDPP